MVLPDVCLLRSADLDPDMRRAIRCLLADAFAGDFSDEDWHHALGGWHAVVQTPAGVVAHASLVARRLWVDGRAWHGGYVEAVAVAPGLQRNGLGTRVMTEINGLLRRRFAIGALSTGEWHFYERLGWERWRGPTFERSRDGGLHRTVDDDDGVMVLRCAASAAMDVTAPIACDARDGDTW